MMLSSLASVTSQEVPFPTDQGPLAAAEWVAVKKGLADVAAGKEALLGELSPLTDPPPHGPRAAGSSGLTERGLRGDDVSGAALRVVSGLVEGCQAPRVGARLNGRGELGIQARVIGIAAGEDMPAVAHLEYELVVGGECDDFAGRSGFIGCGELEEGIRTPVRSAGLDGNEGWSGVLRTEDVEAACWTGDGAGGRANGNAPVEDSA